MASFPYFLASISVPIIGSQVHRVGEKNFEKVMMTACLMVGFTHLCLLTMPSFLLSDSLWGCVFLMPFGFGHSLFNVIVGPIVPKTLGDEYKDQLT